MKKKIIISTLVIIALAAASTELYFKKFQRAPITATHKTVVVLNPVTTGTVPISVVATGNLIANRQADIEPEISGYVTSIPFHEGDYVKQGTLLLQLDSRSQRDKVAQATAQAELSEKNYSRNLKLKQSMFISAQDLDTLHATAQQDLAALNDAKNTLDEMSLHAPFSGYLSAKTISIGDYVQAGQKIVTLTDLRDLKISYQIPARYVDQLKLNQAVAVTPNTTYNKTITGSVSYISPTIDAASQTVEVHAIVPNENQNLKPGEFVSLQQQLGTLPNVILIPENALLGNMEGYYVYEVKNGKVISVNVTPGEHYQGKVVITEGLKPTDQIIVKGQDQVKADDLVSTVTA